MLVYRIPVCQKKIRERAAKLFEFTPFCFLSYNSVSLTVPTDADCNTSIMKSYKPAPSCSRDSFPGSLYVLIGAREDQSHSERVTWALKHIYKTSLTLYSSLVLVLICQILCIIQILIAGILCMVAFESEKLQERHTSTSHPWLIISQWNTWGDFNNGNAEKEVTFQPTATRESLWYEWRKCESKGREGWSELMSDVLLRLSSEQSPQGNLPEARRYYSPLSSFLQSDSDKVRPSSEWSQSPIKGARGYEVSARDC